MTQTVGLVALIIVYLGFFLESITVCAFIFNVSCKSRQISKVQRLLSGVGIILFYMSCICDSILITIHLLKGNDTNLFFIIHTILAICWDLATMMLYLFFLHRIDSISQSSISNNNKLLFILKPMNKENITYNFIIILIIIQLIIRMSTLSQSFEYIGSIVFFITDAIISFFLLYCFAKIILSNIIHRKVLNVNDHQYVAMNDDGSINDNGSIVTNFDTNDRKIISVVAKLWTLTSFIIPLNLILGGVVIYRWYEFDSASKYLLYGNWCLDVIIGNIAILCITLQFKTNQKWYDRLCNSCHKCCIKFLKTRIDRKVVKSLEIQERRNQSGE